MFERQNDSDWTFLISGTCCWVGESLDTSESIKLADGRLHKFVWIAQSGKGYFESFLFLIEEFPRRWELKCKVEDVSKF